MTANTDASSAIVQSLIPARMDRLPWTRFHTRLVLSLGTALILDGLEITLASSEAIAVFFAIAQVFGAVGPILFGALIGAGNNPSRLFIGYAIGGALMIVGGIVELRLGVAAERKELEQIARPADRRHRDPGPAGADAESSLLPKLQAGRSVIGGRLTTEDPARTLRAIPRLTSEDSMTIHACRYLAARGRHRAKDQARPDQHHTPGPRIYAGSRREAQRRHRGQRPAHPVRSI